MKTPNRIVAHWLAPHYQYIYSLYPYLGCLLKETLSFQGKLEDVALHKLQEGIGGRLGKDILPYPSHKKGYTYVCIYKYWCGCAKLGRAE